MDENNHNTQTAQNNVPYETVFCFNCGQKVAKLAIMCPHCGVSLQQQNQQFTQPPQPQQPQHQVVINNTNTNANTNINKPNVEELKVKPITPIVRTCNKWAAFFLCLFGGFLGLHCFYERRIIKGLIYLFTGGCCGFGALIDLILIIMKPNPYTV